MEIKEVEVTKKEKIYTLTEEEYVELQNKAKSYGARKTKEYIAFCFNHYVYSLKGRGCVGGLVEFASNLGRFVTDKTDYIENIYGLTFWDWLHENKE